MINDQALVQEKIFQLLNWEKAKRREKILVSALVYSVLASLIVLPLGDLFPSWARPLSLTPILFLILTSGFLLWHPWRSKESLRAILQLDRTLRLQERALTAWEILRRGGKRPAELWVLEETAANLKAVDVKGLFERRLSWHAFVALPVLLLWALIAWFGVDFHLDWSRESRGASIAKKLKEYSLGLHDRAKENKLTESLEVARALEEVAEKGLKGKIGEEELRTDLIDVAQGIGDQLAAFQGGAGSLPQLSKEALSKLKSDVGELKDALSRPNALPGKGMLGGNVLKKLDNLSPFKGEMGNNPLSGDNMDQNQLRDFIEQLDRRLATEMDRRNLTEAEQFVLLLLDGMDGDATRPMEKQSRMGSSSPSKDDSAKGSLPGDQPGKKGPKVQYPQFRAQAATHLKGLFGKGSSAGVTLRGEFQGRESKVSQDEIVTLYQRQVEGELSSEQIPQDLKETVKSYFLSLGMSGDQK